MNLFKRKQPAGRVIDFEAAARRIEVLKSNDADLHDWYAALPAGSSSVNCPKCGHTLPLQRRYRVFSMSPGTATVEALTVDCVCGFTVYEKTKDAADG
ncbi:hypothetical protein [Nocardia flavorosea]|uniref:Uncharacterized protein n=1 Tax=Nocardia flavorosea TaxID=53429 RepID=A0A846YSM3_9NOCA|nr:hypothetical protein [Nocardia flavorosea]NKY60448.1 hypothetical protein [Nocardia flavorosea]